MRTRSRLRPVRVLAGSAVVLALLSGCGDDGDDSPDADETPSATTDPSPSGSDSATSEPTPEPTETAPPASAGSVLTTKGLAQGAPPAVDYLAAADPSSPGGTWSLVRATGEKVELDVDRPFGFVPMGNGLVVMADADDGDGDGAAVATLDGTGGEVTREEARGYGLAVTADGTIAAWLSPDGSVHGVEAGGTRTFELPKVEGASEMGAIAGEGTCYEGESEIGGCTAYVDVDEPRQAWLTSSHGIVDVAGSMLSVVDAARGVGVVGLISVTDEGSCGGIFVKPAKPKWQTCDHTLTAFSPDGTRVAGTDAYLDGFGQRSIAVLDAQDGTVLHEFSSKGRGPTVLQTAWENEDHVLAVVYERGRWSIVRVGVDGSAELAVAPVDGADLDRPFVLAEE